MPARRNANRRSGEGLGLTKNPGNWAKKQTKKRDGHGGFGHLTRMRAPQSNDPQTKTTSGQYEVGGFISEIQFLKIKIPTAKPTDPAKSKKVTCSKLKKSRYKFIQNSKFFSRITMDHPSPPQVEWPPQTVVCKTSVPPLLTLKGGKAKLDFFRRPRAPISRGGKTQDIPKKRHLYTQPPPTKDAPSAVFAVDAASGITTGPSPTQKAVEQPEVRCSV